MLTARDADLLGVPVGWVYERSRQVLIPTVTLGRYRRYCPEAVQRWIEATEAGATAGMTQESTQMLVHEPRTAVHLRDSHLVRAIASDVVGQQR